MYDNAAKLHVHVVSVLNNHCPVRPVYIRFQTFNNNDNNMFIDVLEVQKAYHKYRKNI